MNSKDIEVGKIFCNKMNNSLVTVVSIEKVYGDSIHYVNFKLLDNNDIYHCSKSTFKKIYKTNKKYNTRLYREIMGICNV